jgi:hypothetical protein
MDFSETAQRGHSRVDGDDAGFYGGNTENVAESNKMKLAIEGADEAIRACNERLLTEIEAAGHVLPTGTIVARIYTAYCAIEGGGGQEQFLAERGIKIHGNTKNACYPVFQAFTKKAHSWLRDRVCKYATVAALARHENVSPGDFPEWQKRHPVEVACEEYRKIKSELNKAKRRAFMIDPKKEPDKAPLLPATPITVARLGLRLGVIEFAKDGSGDFRLLGVLPHDRGAVMRIVEAATSEAT